MEGISMKLTDDIQRNFLLYLIWTGVFLSSGFLYAQGKQINDIQKKVDAISQQLETPTKYSAKDIQRLKELCK